MTVWLIGGVDQGVGATTVVVGLAHRLAHVGRTVRVERLTGDPLANADAELYGTLDFMKSSGVPLSMEGLADALPSRKEILVVEAPFGVNPGSLAARFGARLLLVAREGMDVTLSAGGVLMRTRVGTGAVLGESLSWLPEDRLLAAPTVGRLIEACDARVLARSRAGDAAIIEHILIGAISHDATDVSYFERHSRTAVVTRAEKVDIALGALRSGVSCLILSGGSDPSPYLLDRVASNRATTLLVTPRGTVETVREIEGTFASTPFAGDAKVSRVGELMATAVDDEVLARLVDG